MTRGPGNFDGLRLLAASLVMAGHVGVIWSPVGPWLSQPGLLILFSISGFLGAGSWRSDSDFWRFLARTLLRIWPAYALLILICAGLAYPAHPEAAVALLHSLWFDYRAAGINGSIWMTSIEVSLYMLLALSDAGTRLIALVLVAFLWWMAGHFPALVGSTSVSSSPSACCCRPTHRSCGGRHGDLSYGILLWHAPILHVVVVPLDLGIWLTGIATAVLSAGAAFVSWHLIERRGLGMNACLVVSRGPRSRRTVDGRSHAGA